MNNCKIENADELEVEAICAGLRTFNDRAVPGIAFIPVQLSAKASNGKLIGGFVGTVYMGWLAIDVLWVSEESRGQGLGASLLGRAEELALEAGARAAFLDTFSWQAEAFYRRNGYVQFGRLDDFPTGFSRLFMNKPLTPASSDTIDNTDFNT